MPTEIWTGGGEGIGKKEKERKKEEVILIKSRESRDTHLAAGRMLRDLGDLGNPFVTVHFARNIFFRTEQTKADPTCPNPKKSSEARSMSPGYVLSQKLCHGVASDFLLLA